MAGVSPPVAPWQGAKLGRMASETATIRVPRETRDLLAQRARERGMSLSAMLTEFAHATTRDALFAAERAATRADASNPDAVRELDEWEDSLGDGVD